MGNSLKPLFAAVFGRRKAKQTYSRSQLDHPERIPVKQLTSTKDTLQDFNKVSASATTTQTGVPSHVCSNFYLACRQNNFEEAQKLLQDMTLHEVDRIEPNGSTALHSASYHGHSRIVELLLKAGVNRAIMNKYQCIPYDEAKDDDIKELFLRIPNSNRLATCTGVIEWERIDEDVMEKAAEERTIIKSLYDNAMRENRINKMFENIEKNYVNKGVTNISGIEIIRRYFRQAADELNAKWIITAYTAETDFYRILNTEIAVGATQYQSERRYIIALISHHDSLEEYAFIGTAYRVMQINKDDMQKYQIDSLLMTKSFLSSSIDRKVVELLSCRQVTATQSENNVSPRCKVDGTIIKTWVICKYQIKHRRTALYIEDVSQYANEAEILIMPYSVFKVKKIEQVQYSYTENVENVTEIELEECEEY
ncbi:unnamed protein product [Rotaria magnacalcarata]|uniref:Uncharacterized protein n=1 Tax=Rotaria magnacalcarata TaxID=392030 RepID=A0A816U0H3_9BILA|nr:unnamed protein product [Rotaria magnacalcarata]CAF2121341.1 unnamed protein product [Rotaria magnacalcarata]CAF3875277.1 unnamed protein product [Rotaria magnacalcarata]CAF3931091.1 unnamed protein product [Rotaria magnacalcarata]